jgi:hypothetical protein
MRRREKFIISSILLAFALLFIQYIPLQFRWVAILIFFFLSYGVSAWALFDDLYGVEWITIVPLPAMYAVAVSLFYFLLPNNTLSRVFIIALFGVGMYALFLTSNIYSVAKTRTIQLLRAAHTIGLFFTLLISTFYTHFLFSLHLHPFLNFLIVGVIHIPLFLMLLWGVDLQPQITSRIKIFTAVFSLIMAEFAFIFSSFPLSVWNASLLTTSIFYILVGILHNYLQERLFRNTLIEYFVFGGLVSFSFFLLIQWK